MVIQTFSTSLSVQANGDGCSISSPASGNYSVEVCITSPIDGSILSGEVNVTSTVATIGSSPGVQRLVFYLNNEYLLTDFESNYSFLLPTQKFIDGSYVLSVVAVMRDGYVFQMGSVSVTFNNGISSTPINTNSFEPFTSPIKPDGQPLMVAAGGDGASGITNANNVTNLIKNLNPDMFLYLGDVYNKGTYTEFINWYGNDQTFFGQFKNITNPIVGNHEYENGVAPGYFDYWDNVPDYYSYDAGGWHFIALNSNYSVVPVGTGSPQFQWLQSDLNANSEKCTVVYFHHPLFNIGPPSSTTELMDIWNLMVDSGVEIALTGHDHTYQRWSPLGTDGQLDPNGIIQFVAGASGHGVQTITKSDNRVAFYSDANPGALGVLMLALNSSGANFSYVNIAGEVIDSGVIPCDNNGQDTQAPTIPGNVNVNVVNSTTVDINWSASIDNTGVAGYTIYRNGVEIIDVPSGITSYRDNTLLPETSYEFQVNAFDLAGNHSGLSNPVSISTPPLPETLIFPVFADTYVNSGNPTSNYGRSTSLRMDASPDLHGYLKFNINGLAGNPVYSARLQIFSNSSSSIGFRVRNVINNNWDEYTMTNNNAPDMLDVINTTGTISSNSWVEVDVTSAITGEGIFSFGLDTLSSSAMSVASRESGVNTALLVIDLQLASVDHQPPTTPSGLTSSTELNPLRVNLSWSPSIDNVGVAGYEVFRDGQLIGNISGNTTTFTDTSVSPLTNYSYTVKAFDQEGNHSSSSNAINILTPENQPPTIPADFNAILLTDNTVQLNWLSSTDNTSVAGYTIYRNGFELVTLTAEYQSVVDNSVQIGATYEYAIDAFDQTGNRSLKSPTVSLTIQDNTPPTIPTGLNTSSISPNQVDLVWNPSSDNVGIASYTLYRNGAVLSTVGGSITTYSDTTVSPNMQYSYSIDAVDQAGNHSNVSDSVLVNTPDLPQEIILLPFADAYVDVGRPTNNYGSSTTLRLDASPDLHSYLKFLIPDLGVRSILKAQLFLYSNSSIRKDIRVFAVSNNNWSENSINYNNAPTLGNLISSIGPQAGNTWAVFDVTSYLNGSGEFSFGVTTTHTTNINLASKESGNNSPYLVLDLYTPVPDLSAPTTPEGLTAQAVNPNQVDLSWFAAVDDIGVVGYKIFRDGVELVTVSEPTTQYSDTAVFPTTEYSYSISAFDAAGKYSDVSSPVSVITPDIPDVLSVTPIADTYVNSGSPNSNYGTSTSLRADASPDLHSYLKFNISNLNQKLISKAQLFIYATNRSSRGLDIHFVENNSWDEKTITFNNRPVQGSVIATNGSSNSGVWLAFDVTSIVNSEGLFSFSVTTPGSSSISMASRESGANSPYMILDLYRIQPDVESPTTPSALAASVINTSDVELTWAAAEDNVEVVGYTIYRDAAAITTVSGSTLSFIDTNLTPATTYQYSIDAFDVAGNRSPLSTSIEVSLPSNDQEPPSTPIGLTATAVSQTQIDLNWVASSDNVGVSGYVIYRDGQILTTVPSSTLNFQDLSVQANTTYSYTIMSFDLAGNYSSLSEPVQATTPDLPSSLVFTTIADSYVNESSPSSNYGTNPALRVDATPVLNSYLLFSVQGIQNRTITKAQLFVYSNSTSGQTVIASSVLDNNWGEATINFTNSPVMDGVIASTTGITTGTWFTLDITSYITGEGTYSIGLSTSGTTALSFSSKETGANAPYLVLEFN